MNISRAVVYDIEVFPNLFCIYAEELNGEASIYLEISQFRDDRATLMQWFAMLHDQQTPMIGFNNLGYDYNVIHEIFKNPQITVEQIYQINESLINQPVMGFRKTVWESDRFAPQIDLFKISHFDNKAKSTSLKALQVNMRSENVKESGVPFGVPVSFEDVQKEVIPYVIHDVRETKKFAKHCKKAIEFRLGLDLKGDVINFNDTKIGAKILEERLGEDVCYSRDPHSNRKQPRQTVRSKIALRDIIFSYVQFQHPEFQRVYNWMMEQTLTSDDLDDPEAAIKTKGVFSGIHANVGGISFHYGTGGIHGSVERKRFVATDDWLIRDIDVASLYPNIGIKNRLAPAHLGEAFVTEYARLPEDRKRFQKEFGKKSVPANSMKLAANGSYGNTNNKYSVFYDPQYTMTVTINGQLLLSMLAEWLITVPTFQIIQINTDGITYMIHRGYEPQAAALCKRWEAMTRLELEAADYSRMWIRDVNSYIGEFTDGTLKQKGAYWHPEDGERYADSISEQQPPAWHKDLGGCVAIRAAVNAMVHGIDPETYIRMHTDPFDFMLRVKVDKASTLMLGEREVQRITRYYVAREGETLTKVSPPAKGAKVGEYKRAQKLTDAFFNSVMAEIGLGVWDARIHTKNKSKYEIGRTGIQAGRKVAECNFAGDFRFDNIDVAYYVEEAKKLLV